MGTPYLQPANREIKVIKELLEHGKGKEALAKCEKQLRKDKNNTGLLALKAVCLCKLAKYEDSWALCVQLSERPPAITDIETLETVSNCYDEITNRFRADLDSDHVRAKLANLWMGATKAGGDEGVVHAWILHSLRNARFEDFQKATLLLTKENPKSLTFHFWSVVGWLVAGEALRFKKPVESQTFLKLASAQIEKAARDTPKDPASGPKSTRWVATSGQLRLLVQILQRQKRYKELIKILDSPNLGILSKLAMKDWSLVRTKLEIMEAEAMWKELWDFCSTLITNAISSAKQLSTGLNFGTQGDDWAVWRALLKAQAGMQGSGSQSHDPQTIATAFIQQRPLSRNARLASLEAHVRERRHDIVNGEAKASTSGENLPSTLLIACMKYFSDFGTRYHCFGDLRRFVGEFDLEERDLFRKHVSGVAYHLKPNASSSEEDKLLWLNAELNGLKIDYMMEVSAPTSRPAYLIHVFVATAVRLYNWSRQCGANLPTTDLQPGDDACLLAASALVKLGENSGVDHFILQAAVLLEGLLEHSPSNSDAKMLLVRIYIFLGLGTLAFRWYNSLHLRKAQLISLSHLLYTRISTIHPYPMTFNEGRGMQRTSCDPYQGLKEILDFYTQTLNGKMPELMFNALEEGAYDKVYEFFKFAGSLRHDFSRKMWVLERRRIARLRGIPYDTDDLDYVDVGSDATIYADTPSPNIPYYVDNRDFVTGADFEYEQHCSVGDSMPDSGSQYAKSYTFRRGMPKPEMRWLSVSIAYDILCCFVLPEMEIPKIPRAVWFVQPSGARPDHQEQILNPKMIKDLVRLSDQDSNVSVEQCLDNIETWLDEFAQSMKAASETLRSMSLGKAKPLCLATYLQTTFLALDTLKVLWQLCALLTDQRKCNLKLPHLRRIPKDRIMKIRVAIEKTFDGIMNQTKLYKDYLSTSALRWLTDRVLERLQPEGHRVMGDAIQELLGVKFVEDHVEKAVESSLEALDGVFQVKLY